MWFVGLNCCPGYIGCCGLFCLWIILVGGLYLLRVCLLIAEVDGRCCVSRVLLFGALGLLRLWYFAYMVLGLPRICLL